MKKNAVAAALIASGILLTSTAGAVGWHPSEWFSKPVVTTPAAATAAKTSTSAPAGPIAPATAPNYRAIVERYGPAVVGINTDGMVRTSARGMPQQDGDDPFSQFFRGMPGMQGKPGGVPRALVHGQGSGF